MLALPFRLLRPDGVNGLFDAATTPVWLFPLVIWGAISAWRRGMRGVSAGLALYLLLFYVVYLPMGPAVSIWAMGRYHLALLPAAVPLAAIGLWDLLGRTPRFPTAGRRLAAAGLVATLGLAWWPAIAALPMDWQRELAWALELGRRHPELADPRRVRVITPDNRRAFSDLTPRSLLYGLSGGVLRDGNAVTVAHAFERLHVGANATPAVYYEGLYCWLAVGPGELWNPQCAAMHEVFELEPIETLEIDEPTWLLAYAPLRTSDTLRLGLYRVGARRMTPDAAARLLPAPILVRDTRWGPMGSVSGAGHHRMEEPEPPLPEVRAP